MVSIHAPARGATEIERIKAKLIIVSIHAPARGATALLSIFSKFRTVSIHAPARGATLQINKGDFEYEFQSTLPRGERLRC